MSLILRIVDHVNFELIGLSEAEISVIQKHTSRHVKGAFTTAAFKAKIWDGRESLFRDDGIGFLYELDDVLSILEKRLGYDLDHDIDLQITRKEFDLDSIGFVDPDYLKQFSGYTLRDYQTNSINSVIKHHKGILDIGTNGGKSWVCAGISRAFDPILKSVVIVPSENLVNQTYKDYSKTDLNVCALNPSVSPKKRESMIRDNRHVILTDKLFLNCIDHFEKDDWVVIIDESHRFGPVLANALRTSMAHCPVRVGLTATLPKEKADPYKRNMIISTIGGGILESVAQSELISRGISSELNIEMLQTIHPEFASEIDDYQIDWSIEESYLLNNVDRISSIAEFIKSLPKTNTLILCHNGLGVKLSEMLGVDVVIDETPITTREKWYGEFDCKDDFQLVATFGCAGTGLSINRIFRLIMIDVGKNETYILQGIGRGLRLDGEVNKIEVLDISAKMKYSSKHMKDRIKIYDREKFPYTVNNNHLMVKSE